MYMYMYGITITIGTCTYVPLKILQHEFALGLLVGVVTTCTPFGPYRICFTTVFNLILSKLLANVIGITQ